MNEELPGIALIKAERERQMRRTTKFEDGEGWSLDHDDEHIDRELARAALSYVSHYAVNSWMFHERFSRGLQDGKKVYREEEPPVEWPWDESYWNPQDPMRDLVKAGALIAAEIDRLLRKDLKERLEKMT